MLSRLSKCLMVACLAAFALFVTVGATSMLRHLHTSSARFEPAKRRAVAGIPLAFLSWFLGFMVIGGEWAKTRTSRKQRGWCERASRGPVPAQCRVGSPRRARG